MHLAEGVEQGAIGADEAGVVVLGMVVRVALGDGAADEVDGIVGGHARERVEGRRLVGGRRRGEQRLGVGGEVGAPVGRVDVGEDDDLGAALRGLCDPGRGAGEIGGLVGAGGELDASELDGLLEHGGCWRGRHFADEAGAEDGGEGVCGGGLRAKGGGGDGRGSALLVGWEWDVVP